MNKTTLEDSFKNLKNDFDTENPENGHESRFLEKLKSQNTPVVKLSTTKKFNWKPLLGIAASVVLLISLYVVTPQKYEIP